jgi:site-specific recombinase XerD
MAVFSRYLSESFMTHRKIENDSLEPAQNLDPQPLQKIEGYRKERMQFRILSPLKQLCMIMKRFGLLFYLKKPRGFTSGDRPIYMRITVDGSVTELSIQRSCDPVSWDAKVYRAIGKREPFRALNAYLDTLQAKVYEAKLQLIQAGHPVTAENIKNLVLGREIASEERPRMIMEIFTYHNQQMAALVGKEFAAGTLERMEPSLKHSRSFLEWKFKVPDLDIRKLDFEFIADYEFWLKSVRHCDHNTTMKYLSNFRKIVNRCLQNGWLLRDPFTGFKMTKREVERQALTQEQLEAISNKKFVSERLVQVRDIFLFCCYTGLAYADVQKLRRQEIMTGIDGEKWIYTKRQKTDSSSHIPILPAALEIMPRYADHPQAVSSDRVLPVLSNQKMNAYLKEIVDVCGIPQNLTFHIARHTFATTVTLSNGVPIETVSKMLGHRTLKTTQHYAKILDKKISQDMLALKDKLQPPPTMNAIEKKKSG